jgi:hypothetical protein
MAVASAARGGIVGTSGAVVVVANPPADVSSNQWESNTQIRAIAEQQDLMLSQPVSVDIRMPGVSPSQTSENTSPAVIAAGTAVDSFMLHFDPQGSKTAVNATEAIGSITFDEPILGVIAFSDGLNATNSVLGLAGITYSSGPDHGLDFVPGGVGMGNNDQLTLSADDRTLTLDSRASSFADDLRIITATPEPGTALVAGLGWVMITIRRRRMGEFS